MMKVLSGCSCQYCVQKVDRKHICLSCMWTILSVTECYMLTNLTWDVHYSKVTDRVITVEYAAREDGEPPSGGRGGSPGRYRGPSRGSPPAYGRDRSPVRGSGRNRRYEGAPLISFPPHISALVLLSFTQRHLVVLDISMLGCWNDCSKLFSIW